MQENRTAVSFPLGCSQEKVMTKFHEKKKHSPIQKLEATHNALRKNIFKSELFFLM